MAGQNFLSGGKWPIVTLTDAATITIDGTTGIRAFMVSITTSRTIGAPGTGYDGQQISIRIKNTAGTSSTVTLTTGSAGAFRFGSSPTAITAIPTTKTRYITAQYNAADDRWDVLAESGAF